jgi:hypothetical protein
MKRSVILSGKYKCIIYHTSLLEEQTITPNDDIDTVI